MKYLGNSFPINMLMDTWIISLHLRKCFCCHHRTSYHSQFPIIENIQQIFIKPLMYAKNGYRDQSGFRHETNRQAAWGVTWGIITEGDIYRCVGYWIGRTRNPEYKYSIGKSTMDVEISQGCQSMCGGVKIPSGAKGLDQGQGEPWPSFTLLPPSSLHAGLPLKLAGAQSQESPLLPSNGSTSCCPEQRGRGEVDAGAKWVIWSAKPPSEAGQTGAVPGPRSHVPVGEGRQWQTHNLKSSGKKSQMGRRKRLEARAEAVGQVSGCQPLRMCTMSRDREPLGRENGAKWVGICFRSSRPVGIRKWFLFFFPFILLLKQVQGISTWILLPISNCFKVLRKTRNTTKKKTCS